MTPEHDLTAAKERDERLNLLVKECRKGPPRITPTKAPLLAADLSSLLAERDGLRAKLEEVAEERDEAVNWTAIVDRHGTDGFDALGDAWLAMDPIQRMHNAVASVFARWANDELMGRFKSHMTTTLHTAFVEGCLVGVRAEMCNSAVLVTRAETAEAELARVTAERDALRARVERWEPPILSSSGSALAPLPTVGPDRG